MTKDQERIQELEKENAKLKADKRREEKKKYPLYDKDKDVTYVNKHHFYYGDCRDSYPFGCTA